MLPVLSDVTDLAHVRYTSILSENLYTAKSAERVLESHYLTKQTLRPL